MRSNPRSRSLPGRMSGMHPANSLKSAKSYHYNNCTKLIRVRQISVKNNRRLGMGEVIIISVNVSHQLTMLIMTIPHLSDGWGQSW